MPTLANVKGPSAKPQFLVCYLCGQQFGTSSLEIHVPQCYDKKMKVWHNTAPEERGPRPKDPETFDWRRPKDASIDEFNNQQFDAFTDNLAQCENCGRKFLPDRLVVHQRSCDPGRSGGGSKPVAGKGGGGGRPGSQHANGRPSGGGSGGGSSSPAKPKGKGPAFKPQLLVCYLCGQQFGSSSLGIHVPQCYDKKMKVWNNTEPNERGPKPKHPDTVDWDKPKDTSIDEFNNQQFGNFTDNLAQCENCGRKFLPDRLVVHQRSCDPGRSGGGSKPVASRTQTGSSGGSSGPSASPQRAKTSSGAENSNSSTRNPLTKFEPKERNVKSSAGVGASAHSKMPPKLRALQRVLFEEGDLNHDGRIDLSELKELALEVDPSISDNDVQSMMTALDTNGDGVLDEDEWSRWSSGGGGGSRDPRSNRLGSKSGGCSNGASHPEGRKCTQCDAVEYDGSAKFCRDCGNRLPEEAKSAGPSTTCSSCGEDLPEDSQFCGHCGTKVGAPNGAPAAGVTGTVNDGEGDGSGEADVMAMDEQGPSICPNCGFANEDGLAECDECGCDLLGDGEAEGDDADGGHHAPHPPAGGGGGQVQNWRQTQREPLTKATDPEDFPVEDSGPDDRVECNNCGRKFNPDVIAKHEKICNKKKKRVVYNMSKARAEGTELADFKAPTSASIPHKKPPSKWKSQSNDFRNAMKASRELAAAQKNGGPLPPPTYSENAHYVQCKHCGRRFAPDVAERHIPKCSSTINKPKPPPKRR